MSRLPYDIARCVGGECPLKDTCRRFLDSGPQMHPLTLAPAKGRVVEAFR